MVSLTRHLVAAVASTLVLAYSTSAVNVYTMQDSAITAVAPSDRVSASQLFQRQVTISTASRKLARFIYVETSLPGRIFFTYSDKTPADDTTFAKIKISGSSEGAVGFVRTKLYEESNHLYISTNSTGQNVTSEDSLLVEVEMYKKKTIQSLHSIGVADTIVLADVLYTPPAYGSVEEAEIDKSDTWRGYGDRTEIWADYGNFFVSDPSAKFLAFDVSVIGYTNATVQIEVAEMNATRTDAEYWDPLTIGCVSKCSVAVVADQLSPIKVTYENETYSEGSPVCISSNTEVNVTTQLGSDLLYGSDAPKSSWTVQPGGKTCTKLPLPDRVPVLIGDYGYAPAAKKASEVSGGVLSASLSAALAGCIAVVLTTMV